MWVYVLLDHLGPRWSNKMVSTLGPELGTLFVMNCSDITLSFIPNPHVSELLEKTWSNGSLKYWSQCFKARTLTLTLPSIAPIDKNFYKWANLKIWETVGRMHASVLHSSCQLFLLLIFTNPLWGRWMCRKCEGQWEG